MHQDFADWYRIAALETKEVDLKARWTGVDAFAEESTPADLLDAARVFYGLTPGAADFVDRLRAPFKAADEKFLMLDNTVELRVLAGATLVALFDKDKWGPAAALALTCPSYRGQRASPVGDIVRLARESLVSASASLRNPEITPLPAVEKASAEIAKRVDDLQKILQANAGLVSLNDTLTGAIREVASSLVSVLEWALAQQGQQALRLEESNVLWWLFAGYSRDLKVPFGELKSLAIPLLVGKEMADLTSTVPGPYSARAFLAKALKDASSGKKPQSVTLGQAVDASPSDWRKAAVSRPEIQSVEDLCPTLLAVRRAAEADGKEIWLQVFESVTGLKASEAVEPLDLAEQVFEEWLLARAISDLKDA